MRQISYILLALTLTAVACGNIGKKKRANIVTTYTTAPAFDADSAFSFVRLRPIGPEFKQVSFRVCAEGLRITLTRYNHYRAAV